MVSGLAGILIAPLIGRILPLFPAVVTGSLITLLGISLLTVAMNWAAGGDPANPAYGDLKGLAVAFLVFIVIVVLTKYARGIWKSLAILLGILAGIWWRSLWDGSGWKALRKLPGWTLVEPFHFGMPTFHGARS